MTCYTSYIHWLSLCARAVNSGPSESCNKPVIFAFHIFSSSHILTSLCVITARASDIQTLLSVISRHGVVVKLAVIANSKTLASGLNIRSAIQWLGFQQWFLPVGMFVLGVLYATCLNCMKSLCPSAARVHAAGQTPVTARPSYVDRPLCVKCLTDWGLPCSEFIRQGHSCQSPVISYRLLLLHRCHSGFIVRESAQCLLPWPNVTVCGLFMTFKSAGWLA